MSGSWTELMQANPTPASVPDGVLSKYGTTAFDVTRAPGVGNTMIIGTTDLTHSVTAERPRFSSYTRKCVTGATGTSQIRFVQMNAFDPDPSEMAFSIDIYIENPITEFLGASNAFIDIEISASSTTAIGSDYSRWSFNATCLKQGWNTLKIRQADTVSSTGGEGNLPQGVSHPADVGLGFNWAAGGARFFSLRFNNMASQNIYVDQIRRPAKAKSILVIGFDANGASNNDNVFLTKVAPLFAQYNIKSYFTFTYIYELIFAGSSAWNRMKTLYNEWGWDAINHTWDHGATTVGRNTVLSSLVSVTDVCTATFSSAHGITLGSAFKARIRGASVAAMNGVWDMVAATETTATFTAAGSGSATATGTITLNTFLAEVISTDTTENRAIAYHEVVDLGVAQRSSGFSRGSNYIAYPNNSYMQSAVMSYVADLAGLNVGRSDRNGYTNVNEFGIDNPLCMGSWVLDSGSAGTLTSTLQAKVAGAISRGDHIHIYGHFILDDTDPANRIYWPSTPGNEYPPANNGNPNPPSASLSSTGGWWYFGQLKRLVEETIVPAMRAGTLTVMTPTEYVAYMGYKTI